MRAAAARTSSPIDEAERDAARLGLVRAGNRRLDRNRKPEVTRRFDRPLPARPRAARRRAESIRLQQRARLPGVSQTSDDAASACETTASARARSIPPTDGTEPAGRRSHSARPAASPRARRGRIRVGERGYAAWFFEQRPRDPSLADHDREHRLVLHRCSLDRPLDRGCHLVRTRRHRWDEIDDDAHRRGCRRARAE